MNRYIRKIYEYGISSILKSIYFNFRYLPFNQAIKIPILIGNALKINRMYRGGVFASPIHAGILRMFFLDKNFHGIHNGSILINGRLIVNGSGFHYFGVGLRLTIEKDATMEIGNNFSVSAKAKISVRNHLKVGDNNMWSYDNIVMDTDTHQIMSPDGNILNYNKPIVFGNNIWLGCRNIVLKNTSIADGSIIAAGSIINGSYEEENAIISSHGKVLKKNICWKRDWAINEY